MKPFSTELVCSGFGVLYDLELAVRASPRFFFFGPGCASVAEGTVSQVVSFVSPDGFVSCGREAVWGCLFVVGERGSSVSMLLFRVGAAVCSCLRRLGRSVADPVALCPEGWYSSAAVVVVEAGPAACTNWSWWVPVKVVVCTSCC